MFKLLIFGGTTEGRELAGFCAQNAIYADISVATEYGAKLLSASDHIKILIGRLDEGQMRVLLKKVNYSMVIDATHPYAREASANIKSACKAEGTEYCRLLRESSELSGTIVNSVNQAVALLNKNDEKVLVTTGSKSLSEYTAVKDYRKRLTVRLLPTDGVFEYCLKNGFQNAIIQSGPFSVEQNIEHIRISDAGILVTKESGTAGGYPEKVRAAQICGIGLVTIRRPFESGYSNEEIQNILLKKIRS